MWGDFSPHPLRAYRFPLRFVGFLGAVLLLPFLLALISDMVATTLDHTAKAITIQSFASTVSLLSFGVP
jgi:hypothetical protein